MFVKVKSENEGSKSLLVAAKNSNIKSNDIKMIMKENNANYVELEMKQSTTK